MAKGGVRTLFVSPAVRASGRALIPVGISSKISLQQLSVLQRINDGVLSREITPLTRTKLEIAKLELQMLETAGRDQDNHHFTAYLSEELYNDAICWMRQGVKEAGLEALTARLPSLLKKRKGKNFPGITDQNTFEANRVNFFNNCDEKTLPIYFQKRINFLKLEAELLDKLVINGLIPSFGLTPLNNNFIMSYKVLKRRAPRLPEMPEPYREEPPPQIGAPMVVKQLAVKTKSGAERKAPGKKEEGNPINMEKRRRLMERIASLIEGFPSLSEDGAKHDKYVAALKQIPLILLRNRFSAGKVVSIFENILQEARNFQAAGKGEKEKARIKLIGTIYEIIGLAAVISAEIAEGATDPITEVNKEMKAVKFFLPIVKVKKGKIIVHPGTKTRMERIEADGWRGKSKTIVEEKSCIELGLGQVKDDIEMKEQLSRLAFQIAKYGRALKEGAVENLEVNISAEHFEQAVIDALVDLIPKECRNRVKIFQRTSILPPTARVLRYPLPLKG